MTQISINNEAEMVTLAAKLVPRLQKGDVVTLTGDLGAGKTVFARGLINALSLTPQEVPSPTFTLVQVYDLPGITISHFDLYRLEDTTARDILELGWEDALRDGVCLVEWPDRLGGLLPENPIEINITFKENDEAARVVTLTGLEDFV